LERNNKFKKYTERIKNKMNSLKIKISPDSLLNMLKSHVNKMDEEYFFYFILNFQEYLNHLLEHKDKENDNKKPVEPMSNILKSIKAKYSDSDKKKPIKFDNEATNRLRDLQSKLPKREKRVKLL
jgi:hypothetical protein